MTGARFKFGDIVENGWAADSNPKKRGIYLWSFSRTGRMNPGKHVKLLYDDGRTGELRISDDDKMTVIGTIFDKAILAERERCAAIAEGDSKAFDFQGALADGDDMAVGAKSAQIAIAAAIRGEG